MNPVSVEDRRSRRREERPEVPSDLVPGDRSDRVGRFSDGLESRAYEGRNRRIGRFSDGLEQHPQEGLNDRIGRFSDGQELIRGLSLKIGRFSEGLEARGGE